MAKSKSISISDDIFEMLISQLQTTIKVSKFVEQSIIEKLERDTKREKILYSDNFKPL